MNKTVISAKQIKKAYKDLEVLKGVDLIPIRNSTLSCLIQYVINGQKCYPQLEIKIRMVAFYG